MNDQQYLARIEGAHNRLDGLEGRVTKLELSDAVATERDKHIQNSLTKIEGMISKVAWLIIGGIITGIVAFIISGGLHVPG